jgi:hypothetical protein
MSTASSETGKPSLRQHLRVEIKQAHIDAGKPRKSYECMMALAVREATDRVAMSTTRYVYVDDPVGVSATKRVIYALNDTAIKRLKAFDEGKPVKPFVTIMHGV